MKIAAFMPNWVGDAVMATPALRSLRNRFPDAEIVAVAQPVICDTLKGLSSIDRMIRHDRSKGVSRLQRLQRGWSFLNQLRAERFDQAVLFPNSLRSAWNAWCSGAKRRAGFDRDGRRWLLTDRLTPTSRVTPNPVIDEYRRLVSLVGGDAGTRQTELAVTADDTQKRDQFFANAGSEFQTAPYVCLNPGGAFGAAKHWPGGAFSQLARRIVTQTDRHVIVLCGPAERNVASEIVAGAEHPSVISLAEAELSIGLSKSIVQKAELLVTTDSGPRHFAQPFGVPVITLFGPTHIAWSETYYDRAVHLQQQMECGPCQQRVCPLGHHNCMKTLSVDRVFRSVEDCLTREQKTVPPAKVA